MPLCVCLVRVCVLGVCVRFENYSFVFLCLCSYLCVTECMHMSICLYVLCLRMLIRVYVRVNACEYLYKCLRVCEFLCVCECECLC